MITLSAKQEQRGQNAGAACEVVAQPPRVLLTRREDRDALGGEGVSWRDRAVAAIMGGEPCIDVADGRILCGELLQTPNGEQAMIFVSFAWIDGDLLPIDTCLMPIEALADAVNAGRIVAPAGEAM